MSSAAVFPGQGAQRLGMARDFYEEYAEARAVFESAAEALGLDIGAVCFEDDQRLARTEFQQPAILTAELAILAVLRARFGFAPQWFAGHSLGEYAALAAAGVMDAGAAAALVRERGRLMQDAVAVGDGAMTAVLQPALDVARLQALLAEGDPLAVDLANLNSPDQVVLSGAAGEVARAVARLKEDPGFARARAIPLRVSAPFHSRLMRPAADRFRAALDSASAAWRIERAPVVIANLTGEPHLPDGPSVADALTRQICSPVRWGECMSALRARTERVVEIGPGKTLAGFFKGMGVAIESVADVGAARRVFGVE